MIQNTFAVSEVTKHSDNKFNPDTSRISSFVRRELSNEFFEMGYFEIMFFCTSKRHQNPSDES